MSPYDPEHAFVEIRDRCPIRRPRAKAGGRPPPLMSPEPRCARLSSFTSLRRPPTSLGWNGWRDEGGDAAAGSIPQNASARQRGDSLRSLALLSSRGLPEVG